MLRCPFNNFSKCDGSCPFSMPDFAACKLASLLIAIEGQSRGQLAQIATANAHLVEIKDKLDDMTSNNNSLIQPTSNGARVRDSRSYLRLERTEKGKPKYCISLNSDDANMAWSTLGDRCDIAVISKPTPLIILSPGDMYTISKKRQTPRGDIAVYSETNQLINAFGSHRYIFLKVAAKDGLINLIADGDVRD